MVPRRARLRAYDVLAHEQLLVGFFGCIARLAGITVAWGGSSGGNERGERGAPLDAADHVGSTRIAPSPVLLSLEAVLSHACSDTSRSCLQHPTGGTRGKVLCLSTIPERTMSSAISTLGALAVLVAAGWIIDVPAHGHRPRACSAS